MVASGLVLEVEEGFKGEEGSLGLENRRPVGQSEMKCRAVQRESIKSQAQSRKQGNYKMLIFFFH